MAPGKGRRERQLEAFARPPTRRNLPVMRSTRLLSALDRLVAALVGPFAAEIEGHRRINP